MESNFNPDTDILYRNVLNEIPTVNGILSTTHPYGKIYFFIYLC